MTNPYRALCAELLMFSEEAGEICMNELLWPKSDPNCTLLDRARALLDQPVAEGPTDDRLMDIARATDLVYYMGKGCGFASPYQEGTDITAKVLAFARAVLARWGRPTPQPVPEPGAPTDEELVEMWHSSNWFNEGATLREFISITRAVLAKWGNSRGILDSSPQPVAVSERPWEREGWCDKRGRCWYGAPNRPGAVACWDLECEPATDDTYCLPANALPTPETTNG